MMNEKYDCEHCNYYNKISGVCGFCLKKIMKELERNDSDGQNNNKGNK